MEKDAPIEPTPDKTPESKAEPKEIGGRKGPEPTRYGDWEKSGVAVDF